MKHSLLVPLVIATVSAAAAPCLAAPAASPVADYALETLQRVCLPVLHGSDLATSAHKTGFAMKDGQWVLTVDHDTSIVLNPPDVANPHVCGASITAPFADAPALRKAVDAWAHAQTPPLAPVSVAPRADSNWTSSLWSAAGESVALGQEQAGAPTASAQSNLQLTLNPA